ncbi:MAG: hypothetical protein ACJAVV_002629 [Alphaproteobacteria bacterium]|jgi:hypothetical protein
MFTVKLDSLKRVPCKSVLNKNNDMLTAIAIAIAMKLIVKSRLKDQS